MPRHTDIECRTDNRDGLTVVTPPGRIGAEHAAALDRALAGLPARGTRIVVDMSGVEHMGSAGIAALVRLNGMARAAGLGCCLAGLQSAVRKLFEALWLDRVLTMTATMDEALGGAPPPSP